MYILVYLMFRSVGKRRLDCCSVFSMARLLLTPLLSCCLCRLFICAVVLIVCLKCITSSLHFSPPPLHSQEEWFHVQLNLSKAIDTRSVMIPADPQMELLILLSLLPPPSPIFFLRHSISGLVFSGPFSSRSLCCPCAVGAVL